MKLGTVVLCAWAMTALPSLADEGASPEARAFLKEWASAMAEVRASSTSPVACSRSTTRTTGSRAIHVWNSSSGRGSRKFARIECCPQR